MVRCKTFQKKKKIQNRRNKKTNKIKVIEDNEEEISLKENDLSNIEKYLIQLADKKIKELISKFDYIEDKISFNENDFLNLFKNDDKIMNLNLNNKEFNDLIYNISQIKSYEYNKLLVEHLSSWNNLKSIIKKELDLFCEFFYKITICDAKYKNNYKFDINELDNKINSLNLYNRVSKYKYNEIKELIGESKENLVIKIKTNLAEIKKSQLKELLIKNGYSIMKHISQFLPLNYKLNDPINILVKEVLKYLKNCVNSYDNISQYLEIEKELEIKAEEIAKNFLSQNLDELKRGQPLAFPHIPSPPPNSEYFPVTQYHGLSIIDGLKSIGVCISFEYRRKIAERNGIIGYIGRPSENIQMLCLLKAGKLIKPKN